MADKTDITHRTNTSRNKPDPRPSTNDNNKDKENLQAIENTTQVQSKTDDELRQLKSRVEQMKKSHQLEIAALRTELLDSANDVKQLTKDLFSAHEVVASNKEEISDLQQLLIEKEGENDELLRQVIASTTAGPVDDGPKPVGLFYCDKRLESLNLPERVDWHKKVTGLKELQNTHEQNMLPEIDICVIFTGLDEIEHDGSGVILYQKLKSIVEFLSSNDSCKIVVIALPAVENRKYSLQTKLFNCQLSDLQGCQVINPVSSLVKSNFFSEDGFKRWNDDVREKIVIPSVPINRKRNNDQSGMHVSEFLQIPGDFIGTLIGTSGNRIRSLTSDNNVKMNIGKWFAKDRGSADKYVEKMDAVIISGDSTCVNKAKAIVTKMIEDSPEPTAKKAKNN